MIDSKNNFTTFDGLLNLEVLNNFFRFFLFFKKSFCNAKRTAAQTNDAPNLCYPMSLDGQSACPFRLGSGSQLVVSVEFVGGVKVAAPNYGTFEPKPVFGEP